MIPTPNDFGWNTYWERNCVDFLRQALIKVNFNIVEQIIFTVTTRVTTASPSKFFLAKLIRFRQIWLDLGKIEAKFG